MSGQNPGSGGGGGAFDGVDDEKIQQIAQNIETEDALRILGVAKQMYIDPHLFEIRERTKQQPDTVEVREKVEDMEWEEKQDLFYETLHELIAILAEIRERPANAGYGELKSMIRDPYTVEALLLFCEEPNHIDDAYSEQMKDTVSDYLRLVGVRLLPEIYTQAEAEQIEEKFGLR